MHCSTHTHTVHRHTCTYSTCTHLLLFLCLLSFVRDGQLGKWIVLDLGLVLQLMSHLLQHNVTAAGFMAPQSTSKVEHALAMATHYIVIMVALACGTQLSGLSHSRTGQNRVMPRLCLNLLHTAMPSFKGTII